MYRPSCENRTSEIDEMISEKKERAVGSSSCSNSIADVVSATSPTSSGMSITYALRAGRTERSLAYLQA